MNTFKTRKHKRIEQQVSMYGRSIENKDILIEHFYEKIKKLKREQKKDLENLQNSTIALHKNVMSMSIKEFESLK